MTHTFVKNDIVYMWTVDWPLLLLVVVFGIFVVYAMVSANEKIEETCANCEHYRTIFEDTEAEYNICMKLKIDEGEDFSCGHFKEITDD